MRMRREVESDEYGMININELLKDMVRDAPDMMKPAIVGSLICELCNAAACENVPEEERADIDAWEGKSPRDFFEMLVEPMREHLLDGEALVEMWNNHVLQQAEQIVASKEQLTIPTDWLS